MMNAKALTDFLLVTPRDFFFLQVRIPEKKMPETLADFRHFGTLDFPGRIPP
jgi:hypothetical protein